MTEKRWHSVKCACGSTQFQRTLELRWSEAGGVTEQMAPYQCYKCGAQLDIQRFEVEEQLRRKRQELEELEEKVTPSRRKENVQSPGEVQD